jgi:hypothetical protein
VSIEHCDAADQCAPKYVVRWSIDRRDPGKERFSLSA